MKTNYIEPQIKVLQVQGILMSSDTSANLTIQDGTPDPEQPGGVKPW